MRISTLCINGEQGCGGADYFTAAAVREWIREDSDGPHGDPNCSHESCGDKAHLWWYTSYGTARLATDASNPLWVCCACSDALHLCKTISYMIQELPV